MMEDVVFGSKFKSSKFKVQSSRFKVQKGERVRRGM